MADSTAATAPATTTLRRHNSIATSVVVVPNKLSPPATPPHRTTSLQAPQNQNQNAQTLLNLELVSLKSPFSSSSFSYTSLRDVLPSTAAAINSPAASSSAVTLNSGYEISIRNRLVKQAAWAYLQPMAASPTTSSGPDFLRRLWHRFSSGNPVTACLSLIYNHLVQGFARIFHRILHAFRTQVST